MRRFKPLLLTVAVLSITALDFAAFDDISTGREPILLEALVIIFSIPALIGIYWFARK